MRKSRKILTVMVCILMVATAFVVAMPVMADEGDNDDDEERIQGEFYDNGEEDGLVVTTILIILAVVGTTASILAWYGAGDDPNAATYAWAYAGDWGCGNKGSESDEAYMPDMSAESTAGPFTCRHGAYAYAHAKAWWERTDGETLEGKIEKGPIYAWAPNSCYAEAKASAELKGTTAWEKEIGSSGSSANPDNLHMRLTMNFTEFSVKALDNSSLIRDEDSSVEILIQATNSSETWTLFDGLLVNNGTGFVATGSFEQLALIRSEDGEVTFSIWPTIDVDFYVPEGENITITASVISDVFSSCPSVVGGISTPVDKLALLAPYIISMALIIFAIAATTFYAKRKKKQ